MRPEEDNEMHTPESHPMDNNAANHLGDAHAYSLETLMALQKLLEDGIPEQATRTHQQSHQPLQPSPAARQPEPVMFRSVYTGLSDTLLHWAGRLRSVFMRDKKSRSTGKGNSAQHIG